MENHEEDLPKKKKLAPLEIRKDKEVEEEEPLSPCGRLFHQPNFNCNIIAIIGIGKPIDVDVVKVGFEATILRHPRFSSLQVFDDQGKGAAKWVRTKVCLDDHIFIPDVSSVVSESADKFVEDYISNLSKKAVDMTKPLWDLHILNIMTLEAEAVAVLRCHHSLGDGISLMSLLFACMCKTEDHNSLPTIPKSREKKEREEIGPFQIVWRFLEGIMLFLKVVFNTVIDLMRFAATALFLKDTDTAIKGKVGVEFNPKRFVHKTISLEDVKFVKHAMGATVNDVLFGIISAGLTRYLLRRQDGDRDKGRGKLRENIRMRSTILVNVRKSPGLHALADMMAGKKDKPQWGNKIGFIILQFPIVQHNDPLEYVRMGKATMDRKKASREAAFTFLIAKLLLKVLGVKVRYRSHA